MLEPSSPFDSDTTETPLADDESSTAARFDDIRPYTDAEVPAVVASLIHDPQFRAALAESRLPRIWRFSPRLAKTLVAISLEFKARHWQSVGELQLLVGSLMDQLIASSVSAFTVSGFDALPDDGPFLFVANHRDIALDPSFLNYALHREFGKTTRIAIGDNLLGNPLAADLMRLNKSFVVQRSATGTKAVFKALNTTSAYIRASLAEGESVWIAQREGRAKDGLDKTEPAVLKMLALAWRKEIDDFRGFLDKVRLVPVAISYELDPCDVDKASELAERARNPEFVKPENADIDSIKRSLRGDKGRVHLHVGQPLEPIYLQAEAVAEAIDASIRVGLAVFPTHVEAARRLGEEVADSDWPVIPDVMRAFAERVEQCPSEDVGYLLEQYANTCRFSRSDSGNAAEPAIEPTPE